MENLILFDLDGTLTPARMKAEREIVRHLVKLSHCADIGIVSGSPWEYIKEQGSLIWDLGGVPVDRIQIMPCNGTQLYTFDSTAGDFVQTYCGSMRNELSETSYRRLIRILNNIQSQYLCEWAQLPATGNFISYRKSLVNWCPIGRDASRGDREKFVEFDRMYEIRKKFRNLLISNLVMANLHDKIEATLGGNTSIDIYPTGWDKRHALRHLDDSQIPWFVGDRCEQGGNDYPLYLALKDSGRSFKTTGPNQTCDIISLIIEKISDGIEQNT